MILLSNFAYYTMNFQAEDTNLNLKGYIEDLNFHFWSGDRILTFHGKIHWSIWQCHPK